MGSATAGTPLTSLEPAGAVGLYRGAIAALLDERIPFMVGGGYAFRHYTGIERFTKDMDIFVRPSDVDAVLKRLASVGTRAELLFPHWLGKVHGDDPDTFIDVVFSSGNGVAVVDDEWFRHAAIGSVLGLPVPICPAEETIWSKAFVAERERYDGADIAHLIQACGPVLDWARLVRRFGDNWRVLLAHLVLYGFIYPGERDSVPRWVLSALTKRLEAEAAAQAGGGEEENDDDDDDDGTRICRGTLLSREQYLPDIEEHGYRDGRLDDSVRMTRSDIDLWTGAIGEETHHHPAPATQERREHRRRR
jgi:hypothetical protein